ncbi:MAG TPA: hypothetical protein VF030_07450 [Solirubrobacterales bacterium]
MNGERIYHGAIRAFSLAMIAIGLVVLAITLANGGGPASFGFLIGLVFIAVGAGRLWLSTKAS